MGATEDLLRSMPDEVGEDGIVYLTIDPDTREITVPSNEKTFGVETDKDSERKYFRCPRIVGDSIDLSQHKIYISYVSTTSKMLKIFPKADDSYWCDDVAVDGDYITFSWKLSGNVFKEPGFVAFKVLAKKTDGDVLKTRWNTAPAFGTVLLTVPDGESVEERYPDIVTQLLERMDAVEAIATEEAMQGYVNEYLGEHPVQLDKTLTDNTKAAPAGIVGELKGDLVNGNEYDEDFYMFLFPFYLQSHLLEFGKKSGLINGRFVNPYSGNLDVNADYCATDFLPIRTDTNYRTVTSGGTAYYAFYDEDKSYLSGNNLYGVYYVTPPENAKYLRFSCPISSYDTNVFVQWKYPNSTTFNIGENVRVPYSQVTDAPMNETTVVNVSDYTNLRVCLESIQPTENHHYIVKIPNGTYDIKSMYTEEERSVSGFRGLFVPNYTKILGTGNKEDTIIRYDNADSETISQDISALHFMDWVEMENVTVIGTRIRYAIHDDFPSSGCDVNHRYIKNCDFRVYESYYNDCYGSGQIGGADWTFENCTFEVASINESFSVPSFLRCFSNHASTNMINSSKFLFDNCNFKTVNESTASVRLSTMSNGSTALNYATFKGCRINGKITLTEENTDYGRGNLFKVNGYANNFNNADVTLSFTDGVDYSDYVDLH